ncbi:MAG TPA: signal peptidase II [Mariprofundaceae bacterium]|nr:signal peptidase II [Mariprofundaceae bacterium]
MNRTWRQIGLFALLLAADQASKWWIEQQLPFYHLKVIDGFFSIIKAHNFGVAFSMFAHWSNPWRENLLLGVTIGIAAAVFVWWLRERRDTGIVPWLLVMIMAGAAGNIWDRLYYGYVVDFLDVYIRWNGTEYHWPTFNIADSCITVAVVLLLFVSFRKGQ